MRTLLTEGVKLTKPKGSSTFVMAALDPDADGLLKTLNLGDSGYLIADGNGSLVYRSEEQLYGFDFPYQCGTNCDLPDKDSHCRVHIVQDDDVLVLSSDGVLDNLFDEDILTCLHRPRRDPKAFVEASATCIAKLAESKS